MNARLEKRILKVFPKKPLIGDIHVNDDEINDLIDYFIFKTIIICNNPHTSGIDPIYAVACVQIGIKYYDGALWPHINKLIGHKISATDRRVISERFMKTLKYHNKVIVSNTEIIRTINLHAFVSDEFVSDLFGYLYKFYYYNLFRDLRNPDYNKLLNYTIQRIKEDSNEYDIASREYMLKKQTIAGIVNSSSRSTAMKFRWLIKYIDQYIKNDSLPTRSKSRLVRLLSKWLEKSTIKEDLEKEDNDRNARKHYISIPFVKHYNDVFYLVIPRLNLFDVDKNIYANIHIGNKVNKHYLTQVQHSLTTLTDELIVKIDDGEILSEIRVEICDESNVHKDVIVASSDGIIFFNSYGESARYSSKYELKSGSYYSYSEENCIISNSIINQYIEKNYYYTEYDFQSGDMLRYKDIKYLIDNKSFQGLTTRNLLSNVISDNLAVYSNSPEYILLIDKKQRNGTIVQVNNQKLSLDDVTKVVFDDQKEDSLILNFEHHLNEGFNNVVIDVPKKNRIELSFILVKGLSVQFLDAPYVFTDVGFVDINNKSIKGNYEYNNLENIYKFDIANDDSLFFEYIIKDTSIPLMLKIPVFRWSIDGENFYSSVIGDLWHKNFSYKLYVDFMHSITFFDQYYGNHEIRVAGNSKVYEVDLNRIKSWKSIDNDNIISLGLEVNDMEYDFMNLYTQVVVKSISYLIYDEEKNKIEFEIDYFGEDDIYCDVYQNGSIIVDKNIINNPIVRFDHAGTSGLFRISVYKKHIGFNTSFVEIFSETKEMFTDNIEGMKLKLSKYYKTSNGMFSQKFKFRFLHIIKNISKCDESHYCADLLLRAFNHDTKKSENTLIGRVRFNVVNPLPACVIQMNFYDEEFDEEESILYDKTSKKLIYEDDMSLGARERYVRYAELFDYYFDTEIFEGDN